MAGLSKKTRRTIKLVIILALMAALMAAAVFLLPKILKVISLAKEAKSIALDSTESTFRESKTTICYDTYGNTLCTMKDSKDLYYVEFKEIPTTLVYSFIVMEDREFYEHSGIDYKAIVRAMIANSQNDEIVQGASTITQQLARNIFLSMDVTWERKIKEIFLARELEKLYSKDQILEFYLNNIYFGNGYYGVEAAARGYFDKSVAELSLSEQVFIAAIPNNPSRYDPYTKYDNVIGRRDLILKQLKEMDYINSMDYLVATDEKINVVEPKVVTRNNSVETYVRHCATESMMSTLGFTFRYDFATKQEREAYVDVYEKYYTRCQQMLLSGGYTVYTSIDMDIQNALQDAVDNNLKDYTERNEDGVYELQAAGTCIDNSTGNVVAIVGSRSQNLEGFTLNRAYQSYRQPGSSIKPLIVYLPFFQNGNTPDTVVTDEYIEGGPLNADGVFSGEMTAREAVVRSKNTVAWKLLKEITPEEGISFLTSMGYHKVWMDKDVQAIALGGFTYGVTTEEMAGGFATIANGGQYRKPTCIQLIYNARGNIVYNSANRGERVYSSKACEMMTDVLTSVVEPGGTGDGAAPDNAIIGAKTGTTNSNNDAWLCGFSEYYTASVWVGYDYPKTLNVNAKNIFRDFMQDIHEGLEVVELKKWNDESEKETETSASQSGEDKTENDETVSTDAPGGSEVNTGGISDPDMPAGTGGDEDVPGGAGGDVDAPGGGGDVNAPGGAGGDVDAPGGGGDVNAPGEAGGDVDIPGGGGDVNAPGGAG
ncbi:MAG: transglycosylase domain-containing protein [Lachnospira sp.]